MRKASILTCVVCLLTSSAFAQTRREADRTIPSTTATTSEVMGADLKDERVGIKPLVGLGIFRDQRLNTTSRAMYGAGVDINLMPMINEDWSAWYLGVSTGALYSHLGDPNSNLLGMGSDISTGSAGANLLLIPANLKFGYNVTDSLRVGVHGGGNLIYRSIANSVALGSSSQGTGAVWSLFPNVGMDVDLALSRQASLTFRPDLTLAPGEVFFTGAVALILPIG